MRLLPLGAMWCLYDSQLSPVTQDWNQSWHGAKYAWLSTWDGTIYKFEVVKANNHAPMDREGRYGEQCDPLDGRLYEIESPNGQTFSITYRTWTAQEISASPTRLWQIDKVTDPAGRELVFTYNSSQVGGRWVVSKIVLPDLEEVTYSYAGDFLSSVTHPDGSTTTVSYAAGPFDLVAMTLNDPTADIGHRRKTVFLTGGVATVNGTVVPTSMGLVRRITNGEGEVSYFSFAVGSGTSHPMAFYEGGGRLKQMSLAPSVAFYKDGWEIDQNDEVVGTIESTSVLYDFTDYQVEYYRDEVGREIEYEYDSSGRVIFVRYGDGTFESYCYGTDKQVERYRDRNGNVTRATYDANGNQLTRQVGLKDHSTNDGTALDPYTGVPTYDRCATNDVQTSAFAEFEWQYNTAGRLIAEIDGEGNETNYEYDTLGQLAKIIHPADVTSGTRGETLFTYDSVGRLKTQTDPLGHVTEYFYDARGRRISTLYDDGTSEQVVYGTSGNSVGLVVKTIDRLGVVTTYEYDGADRLVTKVTAAAVVENGTEVATPDVAMEETWVYLDGTSDAIEHRRAESLSRFVYDYRGRRARTKVYPRSGTELVSNLTYVDNLLFSSEDPYGRKTYYAHDATDGRLIRTVTGTVPEFSLTDFAAVLNLTRDTSANATYVISDSVYDAVGNLVQSFDGRLVETEYEHDARDRETARVAAAGTTIEARTETDYDDNSNVVEVRSPRYFDANDSRGYQKAKETWTYTGRGLVASHSEAPGTSEAASESFTYDLAGRRVTHTDFAGKVWKTHYDDCCGQTVASENPLGHGSIKNADSAGRAVHLVSVGSYSSHTMNLHDPVNAETYQEVTTRYDGRGRPVARTTWLTARGAVDVSDPPIAGYGGVAASDGITEQYLYDDNLADGAGLDSTTGLSPLVGSYSVNLQAALSKLAATEANGGAGISFSADAPGSARVSINGEGEVSFSIADAAGRTVMSGMLEPASGSSPNALVTWNCTLHDTTASVTGYGTCVVPRSINALGKVRKAYTDAAGRTLRSLDELDKITLYTYDAAGNQLSVRDPNSVGQDCTYDELGRDLTCTDTSSDSTSSGYDLAGNRVSSTDAKSNTTTYAFDARGRQVSQTDRLNGVTAFAYTATGQLASLTDAESQVTSYTYDDAGQKLTEVYPDHVPSSTVGQSGYGIVSFSYDPAGRVDVRTDQQGDTCTYDYDLAGRLTSRAYVGRTGGPLAGQNASDTFTYDDAGRMLTAVSGRYGNTVTYTYDEGGRKATEALTISGQTYTVTTDYDAAGRLTDYTYPDGTAVDRSYTDRGQLHQLTYAGTVVDTRTYDNGGRMTGSAYNNGVSETRGYNTDNTLSSISYSGASIGTYSYGWDDNKNKTSESITGTMSGYGFSVGSSGYDTEDRLVNWQRSDSALAQSWNLSLVGDWDSITENSTTQNRTHGDAHELLTAGGSAVSHDTKGNQTLVPATLSSSALALNWDFENKLSTADVGNNSSVDVTYKFDALGRRVYRDDGTSAVVYVQSGEQTLADYAAGTAASSPTYRYVWASYIDEPVLRVDSSNTKLYYHRNQQYSIVALTNANGSIVERYAYTAYGEPTILSGSGNPQSFATYKNRYTYTGREWDAKLELYHYRARMYSPGAGRFVSRDPIGYEGSQWNLYEYVESGPVSFLDPWGMQTGAPPTAPPPTAPPAGPNPIPGVRPPVPVRPIPLPPPAAIPKPTTPQLVIITVCTYGFYKGGQTCVRPVCTDVWYWLRPSDRPPTLKDRTLDHCLDLGDADYDARASYCAGIRDRQQRAICYSHCNDNKNEWNNYCRGVFLP